MRVLWLTNLILPQYAKTLGLDVPLREGWVGAAFSALTSGAGPGTDLSVCAPVPEGVDSAKRVVDGVTYYGFREDLVHPEVYDPALEAVFKEILKDAEPDIVHIHGTEFPHTLAMVRAFGKPERTLVGIQGLCSEIAKVYTAGLPGEVVGRATFRDAVRADSIREQQEKYRLRGLNECEALRNVKHVTGRTEFDRKKVFEINPDLTYHPVNESLRETFYHGEWSIGNAKPHRIFVSQGDYPIKGLHVMLEALPLIRERYPDAEVVCAGQEIARSGLRASGYGKYLARLIKESGLSDCVKFTGKLDAERMKERFLENALFVCPSLMENSPNALGEAMLLGMPVVASDAGGIPSMVTDGESGLLFPSGDAQALADAVCRVFSDGRLAETLGRAAKEEAHLRHDPKVNGERLLEVYENMKNL